MYPIDNCTWEIPNAAVAAAIVIHRDYLCIRVLCTFWWQRGYVSVIMGNYARA